MSKLRTIRVSTAGSAPSLSDALTVPASVPIPDPAPPPGNYAHYVIERRPDDSMWILGRGGMGITFKAKDTNLHCPVALKIISPECFGGEKSLHRFLREAQLAAQIRHPNVAAIHHLDSQDGHFFYAMEFVDGITAEAWVQRRGRMPVEMALDVAMQVARALTAADQLKVIHRDIKPGNIMILPDPADGNRVIVKVIDFGLAQSRTPETAATATTYAFVGTPQFASPEQAENSEADIRSDIYSLGSTLWYLLLGEAPFIGTPTRVIAQLLMNEPPWEKLRALPTEVQDLLRSMLNKLPAQRPQTPVILYGAICACRERVAARKAAAKMPVAPSRRPPVDVDLRSFAVAGVLALVLLWIGLSVWRGNDGLREPMRHPPVAVDGGGVSSSTTRVEELRGKAVVKRDETGDAFNITNGPVSLAVPDIALSVPASKVATSELAASSFSLSGLMLSPLLSLDGASNVAVASGDEVTSTPMAPLSAAGAAVEDHSPAPREGDRRRGGKHRHGSSGQPMDQIGRSVAGLLRHFF